MKKIYGFAFASAIMALASCSNDSEPVVDNKPNFSGESAYIAINLNSPAGGTRADDDFEMGKGNENIVNNNKSNFYILKKESDGSYKVAYKVTPEDITWTQVDQSNPAVEKFSSPMIVVPSDLNTNPSGQPLVEEDGNVFNTNLKLLVVLNGDGGVAVGDSEADALAKVEAVSTTLSTNGFLMSNAAYETKDDQNNTVQMCATPLPSNKLVNDKNVAANNPVEIYVERVVAKSTVAKAADTTWEVKNNDIYWENSTNDEDHITLVPHILSIKYVNNPKQSNVFKNLDPNKNSWGYTWANDAANFRSYWATMPEEFDGFETFSYNTGVDGAYSAEWAATKAEVWTGSTDYLRENTLGAEDDTQAPMLVALAELVNPETGKAVDMANVYGQFTTLDGAGRLVTNVLNGMGYRIKTTEGEGDAAVTTYSSLVYGTDTEIVMEAAATKLNGDEAFGIEEGKGNRVYLAVKNTKATFVKEDGVDATTFQKKYKDATVEEIDEILLGDGNLVSYWNGGRTYYYTRINHQLINTNPTTYLNGVVRNHVYKITLDGISGLGTPVFDPTKDIVPTQPEYDNKKNVFLAARVNILKWRVASQNVVLGE